MPHDLLVRLRTEADPYPHLDFGNISTYFWGPTSISGQIDSDAVEHLYIKFWHLSFYHNEIMPQSAFGKALFPLGFRETDAS